MHLYDTIYGHIDIDDSLVEIIDTMPFHRLKYIKQLGMVHYLYPGVQHTRFEHSIGVSYLCFNLMKKIQLKQPELNITDRDILLVSVAGLIHDIGHACFSHFFDDKLLNDKNIINETHINYELKHHEARSEYIFKDIVKNYNLNYTQEEVHLICTYVNPKKYNIKVNTKITNKFKYEIVNNYISGFDCDKLDYLVRDSYYLGNKINLNILSLLDNAVVINDNICYPNDMMIDVYTVYYLRFIFHKKYYSNNTTRCIEYMIYDAMLKSSLFTNIADILNTDKFYNFTDNILQLMLISNDDLNIISNNVQLNELDNISNNVQLNELNNIELNNIELNTNISSNIQSNELDNISNNTDTNTNLSNNIIDINIFNEKTINNTNASNIIKNIYNRKLYKVISGESINIDDEINLNYIINEFINFLKFNNIQDDFIFDISKINYGKGKINPIQFIKFYKKNINNTYEIVETNKKLIKTFPINYEEILLRITIRDNDPKKKIYYNLKSYNDLLDQTVLDNNITMELLGELMMIIIMDYINN